MAMFGNRKLKSEIVRLTYRVAELEERLCPCEQHLWLHVKDSFTGGTGIGDEQVLRTYKCKRCGKTTTTWRLLQTAKEVT